MKSVKDYFGNEVLLKSENAEIFYNYFLNFCKKEVHLYGKLFHTFRVADACIEVGEKLGLDKELCYNIGLLHDYGRFYQWLKYKTFNDKKSEDHADLSSKLLFDKNEIQKFKIDKSDYDIIRIAIENHNKKEINLEQLKNCNDTSFKNLLMLCKLIRDCDKIDIIYRLSIGDISFNINKSGVTPNVVKSIQEHKCVNKNDVNSSADEILTWVGYLYDINFTETLKYINFDKFWDGMDKFYVAKIDENDKPKVKENLNIIKDFIDLRLNNELQDEI